MKFIKAFFAAVALTAASVGPAFADITSVQITGAIYGGNGCPDNSAAVFVSPDGQELTILFDKFIALANSQAESRKSCNLSIGIQLPQGFQVSLYDADYRGYVSAATTGTLRAEYFFAGSRGPVFTRSLIGGTDYFVRDSLATVANVWSACGDSVNMRVNASMRASGAGMATVDSFDLANRGLIYHLRYRRCV
ncbi:MAG: DUF4360 domain-containing protein [Nostoc sp.]|uniref:DUF4360 domain-containing protein n=1 Tax=Nostoc sp. TaxID=1180 RepID=UPI002FF87A97